MMSEATFVVGDADAGIRERLDEEINAYNAAASNLDVHLRIVRVDGLTVFDACPTKADYEQFTGSDMFRDAVAAAGLPAPRIEGLGDVRVAHLSKEIRP
jgi:hypothetical protein